MLLVFALLLQGCAGLRGLRDPWTGTDTVLQATYTALHVMDWSQALHIARNPKTHTEGNKVLGEHPSTGRVNAYFATTLALQTIIPMKLNKPWRNIWQGTWIINQYFIVQHNRRAGLGITLHF